VRDGLDFFSFTLRRPSPGNSSVSSFSLSLNLNLNLFGMLSRQLRLAASSALRAESSSSSSGGWLAQQLGSSQLASPFFSTAVRAISSVSASPSRAALLASASASSARSASGHAASCSYSCKSVQNKLLGASSQRGFAADAAVAAIDESDDDDKEGKKGSGFSPPVAVRTLPDVPPGSR
jgi:hypothetical protein